MLTRNRTLPPGQAVDLRKRPSSVAISRNRQFLDVGTGLPTQNNVHAWRPTRFEAQRITERYPQGYFLTGVDRKP
jgi:hypothetical protein